MQITLLTKDDCGFCDHAKQVLRRLGDTYPVRVTEIGTPEMRLAATLPALHAMARGLPLRTERRKEERGKTERNCFAVSGEIAFNHGAQ